MLENVFNEKLHNLWPSVNINRIVKSISMKWVKYVERIGNGLNIFRFSVKENGGKW
jgi:hypothetical protein